MSPRGDAPAGARKTRQGAGGASAGGASAGAAKLVSGKRIIVACGPGGVGKTTMAAALGVFAAIRDGGKVLVVTVDPARRLADALGIGSIGNTQRQVPMAAFEEAGVKPKGELWAAMLDMKESWDDLVRRHAPDAATRDHILSNPLYQSISARFVQSQDYIAMERLYQIYTDGDYDLVIVDTPPSRNALDFLDAPKRMADFFSSRLLKWLLVPYRAKWINVASRPFYQIADRILGSQFLTDISDFFASFQTMYDGFVRRAQAVERLIEGRETSFIVISTLEEVPLREARTFLDELGSRGLGLSAVLLNKVLPAYLRDPKALALAGQLESETAEIAAEIAGSVTGVDAETLARVLAEMARGFNDFHASAEREARLRKRLEDRSLPVMAVPYMDTEVTDLRGLFTLAEAIET